MNSKILVFAVLGSMFLWSCNEKDTPAIIPELGISQNSLNFEANSKEAQTIELTSNVAWTAQIEQSGDWLSVEPASGNGNATLSFTAAESKSPQRTASITVAAVGAEVQTITVTQAAYKGKFYDFQDKQGWDGAGTIVDNAECNDGKALRIETAANSEERNKLRSNLQFGSGIYTWRIYVPDLQNGDQVAIAGFLYADDQHELDFEIGSGTSADRAQYNAQADEVLCYTTSQGNPSAQQVKKIKKNAWHTLVIDLKLEGNNYFAEWKVDGESFFQRQLNFGEETLFSIFCSVENLSFIGDHLPTSLNYALFDYMEYLPYSYSISPFDPNAPISGPEPEGITTKWDFNETGGEVPAGWTGRGDWSIADGYLKLITTATSVFNYALNYNTEQVGAGKYTWRMFVPDVEQGGKILMGGSLYYYLEGEGIERSFSIMVFYGTAADRAATTPAPTGSQLLLRCYTEAGTYFQPVNPNQEYTLTIDLRSVNGKYAVRYLLDNEEVETVLTQHPSDARFDLSCTTMGNGGAWQGISECTNSYEVKFDWFEYKKYQ